MKIGGRGQVTIPKKIREKYGLMPYIVEECADCDIGHFLMDKIKELNPEYIVTDCLSCLLQFNQVLPYRVLHLIEILKQCRHNENFIELKFLLE